MSLVSLSHAIGMDICLQWSFPQMEENNFIERQTYWKDFNENEYVSSWNIMHKQ